MLVAGDGKSVPAATACCGQVVNLAHNVYLNCKVVVIFRVRRGAPGALPHTLFRWMTTFQMADLFPRVKSNSIRAGVR